MIVVLVLFILTILSIKRNKDWAAPTALMCGLWFAILLAYEADIVSLYSIKTNTYIVMLVGILSFMVGSAIANRTKFSIVSHVEKGDNEHDYMPRYKIILFLAVISLILQIPDTINSINVLSSGGNFFDLRSDVNNTVIDNAIVNAAQNYIFRPFIIFLYPISAYCFLTRKADENKRMRAIKGWIVVFGALVSVMQMFTSGGRASVVYFIVHFIVLAQLMKKKVRISRAAKISIAVAIVAIVVVVYNISASREIENVLESFVYYFDGCVPLMDHHLEKTIYASSYTYGGSFFFAPLQLVFTLLSNIGIPNPEFMVQLTEMLNVEMPIDVGPTINMNAFVSWFFYLFKDGGYITLVIEGMIYGGICRSFYKGAINNRDNVRKIIGYSIITNTIVFSMVRYQLVSYHYLLAFLMVILLIKPVRIEKDSIVKR